jgi:hypothetical protein
MFEEAKRLIAGKAAGGKLLGKGWDLLTYLFSADCRHACRKFWLFEGPWFDSEYSLHFSGLQVSLPVI